MMKSGKFEVFAVEYGQGTDDSGKRITRTEVRFGIRSRDPGASVHSAVSMSGGFCGSVSFEGHEPVAFSPGDIIEVGIMKVPR